MTRGGTTNLYAGFAERSSGRQALSGAHAGVVRLVELFFQLFELLRRKGSPIASKLWLIAVQAVGVLALDICNKR